VIFPTCLFLTSGVVLGCMTKDLSLEHETRKSSNALLRRGWSPGWNNGDKALDEFLVGPLLYYAKNRQKVDGPTTSLISPHLHFEELSVRKCFIACEGNRSFG
jgi:deoxyribodipyrimidine photolyase